MKAVRNYKERTLTLSECSAEEVRTVLEGLTDEPEVLVLLHQILTIQGESMSLLDDQIGILKAQVAQNTTISSSALTLIQGIPGLIDAAVAKAQAAGATPAQLQDIMDLSASIKSSDDSLAAAVSANTPGAPPPVVDPGTPTAG